jgi:hypothetical protein
VPLEVIAAAVLFAVKVHTDAVIVPVFVIPTVEFAVTAQLFNCRIALVPLFIPTPFDDPPLIVEFDTTTEPVALF